LRVREVLNKDVIKVRPSTSLAELLDLFKEFHTFPMVPVVDAENRVIGKVSFENFLEVFQPHGADTKHLLKAVSFVDQEEPLSIFGVEITPEMGVLFIVEDLMDRRVITIREDSSLEEAYNLMKMHNLEHLPVVNAENQFVGMLGVFDIVLAIFRERGILK
jgi:CBS domain-containing protein